MISLILAFSKFTQNINRNTLIKIRVTPCLSLYMDMCLNGYILISICTITHTCTYRETRIYTHTFQETKFNNYVSFVCLLYYL